MTYTEKGLTNEPTIDFLNVKEFGVTTEALISIKNNYTINSTDEITSKLSNVINAIDIDWNGATFKVLGKNTSLYPYATINTTGDLLRAVGNAIDEVYSESFNANNIAENAQDTADKAYDWAKQAYTTAKAAAAGISDDTINGIKDLISDQLSDQLNNLIIIDSPNDTIGISTITKNGTGYISIDVDTNTIATIDYVDDKIDGIEIPTIHNEESNPSYLTITFEDNEYFIDVDTSIIATKEYVDNKGINSITGVKGINVTDPNGDHNFKVSMVLNENQFTINNDLGELNLSDSILSKINSGTDSGITINDVSNYLTTNSYITSSALSDYVKIGDDTTSGSLSIIDTDNNTVSKSNITTDGDNIYISSDINLKENIDTITDEEINLLFNSETGFMHSFNWKNGNKSFGFIAQELEEFSPESIYKNEYLKVNYNSALTKVCAALFIKIKQLENKIKQIEGES